MASSRSGGPRCWARSWRGSHGCSSRSSPPRNPSATVGPRAATLRECALVYPVDMEETLREQPDAVPLHEGVEVAQRGDHEAPLPTVEGDVMRQAVDFPGASVAREREDRALADEVRGGLVFVQLREHGSERFPRVQLL